MIESPIFPRERFETYLDAVDSALSYPSVHKQLSELFHHDEISGLHTLRVTTVLVHTALSTGLDGNFAAICGITHDLGKLDVKQADLRNANNRADVIERIRLGHMNGARARILAIPGSELTDAQKKLLLQVVMAHHEVLSHDPERPPYPRTKKRDDPSESVQTMQLLLALCDIADRIAYGARGIANQSPDNLYEQLFTIVEQADITVDIREVDMMIRRVAEGTATLSRGQLQRAYSSAGIE